MDDQLYVIGVGGTGMRCLESFVHLCAIGMLDGKEINVLTLDTDANNGNLKRVKDLITSYRRIKSGTVNDGGTPNRNTFFSSKLNYYHYHTNYMKQGKRDNYRNLSNLSGQSSVEDENQMLADLFLDKDTVQVFDLKHGYRAQTHLGSQLMFHGLVEAAKKLAKGTNITDEEKSLGEFIDKLEQSGKNSRVFVFGSVFGGTGASSIPVLPSALKEAIKIKNEGSNLDISDVKFGSTLLTSYFDFNRPNSTQKENSKESVIASATFFPLNSQAALQFYQGDPTVQSVYNKLYHIGWPLPAKKLDDSTKTETITGGADQKNKCHFVELIAACAALDFFTASSVETTGTAKYVFRTGQYENGAFNFSASDLVGVEQNKDQKLISKLGGFLSLAHISLSKNHAGFGEKGFLGLKRHLENQNIDSFKTSITEADLDELDKYMRSFGYSFTDDGAFKSGWIYQIRNSIAPGKFIFTNEAFAMSIKELKGLDVGKLFEDPNYHWESALTLSGRDTYQPWLKRLVNIEVNTEEHQLTHDKEKFIALLHDGIMISQQQQN